MSDVWHYAVLVEPGPAFSIERVTEIVGLAEARGFSALHPETGRITVANVDIGPGDFHSYEFETFSEAATLLGQKGGLLDLWRGDDTKIGLDFDPTGMDEIRLVRTSRLPDTPSFGHLSISVGAYLFREDEWHRVRLALAVERLFADLCMSQKGVYGFSLDEDAFEVFASQMRLHEGARFRQRPSVLFWLNYFTTEHWAQIGEHGKLRQFGGKIKKLPTGVIVSFFARPWDVDLGKLYSINEKWQMLQG